MMKNQSLKLYLLPALLLLSACTKTVYQPVGEIEIETEAATETEADTTSEVDTQVNNPSITSLGGVQNDDFEGTSIPASSAFEDDGITATNAASDTTEIVAAVANAASSSIDVKNDAAITGEPGEIVDCNLLLPCSWVDTDELFTVTVGSVDNTATLERLSIQYTVNASHDTELILGNGTTALEPGGASYSLIQQTLGSGNGIVPLPVLAGEPTVGSANFNRAADSDTLAGWTLTIIDNGLPRTVGFLNLPVGGFNDITVDCAGVLPCQWVSSRDDVRITLLAIGGFATNGRLNVNFNIETVGDKDIVLDTGATAFGTNGEQFDGRTHGLGIEQGFAEVNVSTVSGVTLAGHIDFFRTSTQPTALQKMDMVIYEDAPTPRWNPQFINLPTQ